MQRSCLKIKLFQVDFIVDYFQRNASHKMSLSSHNEMQQTFTNKLNLIQIHASHQNHTKQWQRLCLVYVRT